MLLPNQQSYPSYNAYLILQLSFEAIVFAITLITTVEASRNLPTLRWLKVMQRDGFLYFCAMFSSTLLWLLLSYCGKDNLRTINALPCSSFTAIMINRLYLSLKEVGQEPDVNSELFRKPEQVELRVMLSTDVTSTVR
ncbi:hypothetical protein L208DRAFT_1385275 [Tricholoma matsutake]|nr:hypothetical protein L208DRAFT_1385275 [Tricholoma matsutake 945]